LCERHAGDERGEQKNVQKTAQHGALAQHALR
jgi:hypothetical protein